MAVTKETFSIQEYSKNYLKLTTLIEYSDLVVGIEETNYEDGSVADIRFFVPYRKADAFIEKLELSVKNKLIQHFDVEAANISTEYGQPVPSGDIYVTIKTIMLY